jgi:hypothetical protein
MDYCIVVAAMKLEHLHARGEQKEGGKSYSSFTAVSPCGSNHRQGALRFGCNHTLRLYQDIMPISETGWKADHDGRGFLKTP